MKTKFNLIVILCLTFLMVNGQQNVPPFTVENVSVTPPKFAGVENAVEILNAKESETINGYLSKNFTYIENREVKPEGTEVIQFTVTPSGELTDFVIINSVSRDIDLEIIRILKTTGGMWIPGYSNNVPVEMTKEVSMALYPGENSSKSVTEIFTEKATHYFMDGTKILIEKQNPKKAIKYYSWGLNYLPYDKSLLIMRGISRFENGDKEGAHQDWTRVKELGGAEMEDSYLTENLKGLKSYDELLSMLKE